MDFEKIEISEEDLNSFIKEFKAYEEHYKDTLAPDEDAYKTLLLRYFFTLEEEYKEDEWNSCDIVPPFAHEYCDVLIRPKNLPVTDNPNHTCNCVKYKVGYYNPNFYGPGSGTFVDSYNNALFKKTGRKSYEYKVIE